jgi:hypothetical protein
VPDADLNAQWEVVDAFQAAAREGDFDRPIAVLDPEVELRADGGLTGLSRRVRGAETVASGAMMWSRTDLTMKRALVNGAPGMVSLRDGGPFSVGAFTVSNGRSSSSTSSPTRPAREARPDDPQRLERAPERPAHSYGRCSP